MSAYLYTWNPKRWDWVDQADAIYRVNNGDQYDMYWSCGRTKKIAIGDIFFLMRLGEEPKGIVGCGYVLSLPYALPHWDAKKAANGETALRTNLLFKALSDAPFISLGILQQDYPGYKWMPEAGGLTIPEPIASELFNRIQKDRNSSFTEEPLPEIQRYTEGRRREITTKTYDRSPLARQECIKYHGYNCDVCGLNFEETYGPIGTSYIEVHHLRPVADVDAEYLIDPIKDLRPVCANCHRMLHKQRPPLSIEELRKRYKSR